MDKHYERVAGLDVHKQTVVATRMRVTADDRVEWETETYGTTTPELLELHDWLAAWACTHVVLESTGDYWQPVYNLLEDTFEVLLVNAQHVKRVPGRKTDVSDAEWLAELQLHGLLKASFIPPKPQRALRELTRYRSKLIQERARTVNRVQKLLEGANLKLASVVSDIQGISAQEMLRQIARGETDAEALAQLARGRLRKKIGALEKALTGVVQPHHRFLLAKQLAHIDFLDEQIADIGAEIARQVSAMSQPPEEPPAGNSGEAAASDAPPPAGVTWTQAVELLDSIPGVDVAAAEMILAETGIDMRQFPTDKHLAAWAGVAPGNHQSGGKRYSGRTRDGNRQLQTILVQVAWAAVRTKGTFLKARYHRLAARRGKKRAIVAIAHSILVSIWHMLAHGVAYRELGADYYDQRSKGAKVAYLTRQLEKLTGGNVVVNLITDTAI
ncbi:MAG: IS110 family transposase [Anaerolineae bacterium]|nr:IS110 family transposase [Anaerolineae bacterium]